MSRAYQHQAAVLRIGSAHVVAVQKPWPTQSGLPKHASGTVAVVADHLEALAIGDAGAHTEDSHVGHLVGMSRGTLASGSIH